MSLRSYRHSLRKPGESLLKLLTIVYTILAKVLWIVRIGVVFGVEDNPGKLRFAKRLAINVDDLIRNQDYVTANYLMSNKNVIQHS